MMKNTITESRDILYIPAIWLFSTMCLWFFAFYSSSSDPSDWIRRAQIACFGSNEMGLPSASGWILLILSPAALFAALYVALGDELALSFHSMLASSKAKKFLSLTALLIVVEISWVAFSIYDKISFPQGANFAEDPEILPDHYPVSKIKATDFKLTDQHGRTLSLSSFAGKPVVLSFVFAHCQTVCPTLVKTVNSVAEKIGNEKVTTILISLDPWRDTPASLPTLAKKWNLAEGVSILSASPEEVEAVLDAYKVPRQRDMNSGDVAHPAIVHVINPEGEISYTFNDPSVSWLMQAISRISL